MSTDIDRTYLDLVADVLAHGDPVEDRTGVGTLAVFGRQIRVDLSGGFPLLTTKKLHWHSIVTELEWFLTGRTDNDWLVQRGVTIWDEWADADHTGRFGREPGDLGPVYGHQWRNYGATLDPATGRYRPDGVDQIAAVIDSIRTNPTSRRHLVSAWHPGEADAVTLPPCHTLFQFHVHDHRLSCQLYQRSADLALGVPFNIASYALLTTVIAALCDLEPGEFVHTFGDLHIYRNHIEALGVQLERDPRPLPTVTVDPLAGIDDFTTAAVHLHGYDPHPRIPMAVAV